MSERPTQSTPDYLDELLTIDALRSEAKRLRDERDMWKQKADETFVKGWTYD